MTIRLGMQEDGVTNPSASIKAVTKTLVEKLTPLNPKEKIDVILGGGGSAKYILVSTGEVLAEIINE